MKNWKDYLTNEVYIRLCDCRTIKEDCLIAILELLECNSCYFDLTKDEYNELCK